MRTRAYRRHQRARIRARNLRDYRNLLDGTLYDELPAPNDIATRHPLDCGRRCMLCHYDKLSGLRPRKEAADWRRYEHDADAR